jgi:CheY-like chemotaxis protein
VLELNEVVRLNVSMLRSLVGEDVEVTTVFDELAGCVEVDPTQIGQVLMNLTLNAKEAMPHGGRLTIETGGAELGDAYATISVTDTGHGIPVEARDQIFEPFFTTKERGEGAGLGLATAYGIVHQSDGRLSFATDVGAGTTFTIHLPRVEPPALERTSGSPAPAGGTVPRGDETILVIEDEQAVQRLVVRMLREHGYTVLHAPGGEQAIAMVQGYEGRIDLVLSDVVMPGLAGPAAVERIRALRPDIRRLYMSGYSEEAATTRGALDADAPLLGKPFSGDELIQRVAEALETSDDRHAAA